MTKRQIARMVTMIIIAALLVLSVWGYSCEIGKVINPIDYASDVNIDGADFTTLMNGVVFGVNGFLGFIVAVVYCVVLLIIALVLLLPWCLISVRKKSVIAPIELKVAFITYISMFILSVILGLIGAGLNGLLFVLLFAVVVMLVFGLLCVLPYYLADKRCKKAEIEDES
ncbi:MAG: hypothetical protein J6A73_08060 [Lachnospiraceae bacterium]|nr:hypothetical protein [Lachnospiraceae bacterium]